METNYLLYKEESVTYCKEN